MSKYLSTRGSNGKVICGKTIKLWMFDVEMKTKLLTIWLEFYYISFVVSVQSMPKCMVLEPVVLELQQNRKTPDVGS